MTDRFEGLVEHLLNGGVSLAEATRLLERGMIAGALDRNGANQCAAARALKMHRNTLQRKMVEYDLPPARPRTHRKPMGRAGNSRNRKSNIA
jgi:DNA-binding NtrC family response regulator